MDGHMDTNFIKNPTGGIDDGLLAEIVHEFNLARRNVSSYPKGHPVVARSCERVADLFERLLSDRDELTFGIAKETLLFGADSLARTTPAVKGVARVLFYHGIALITFRKGLTPKEIEEFNGILALKRARISADGGMDQLMHRAGIENLRITRIRYDAFHAGGDSAGSDRYDPALSSLWECFVRGLMQDVPSLGSDGDVPATPEALAELLNGLYGDAPRLIAENLETSGWEINGPAALPEGDQESIRKIGAFIAKLDRKLRGYFLEGLLNSITGPEDASLRVLCQLPPDMVPEIAEYVHCNKPILSPLAVEVVERLIGLSAPDGLVSGSAGSGGPIREESADDELEGLLLEEAEEEFVPPEYLETLRELASARELPELAGAELDQLKRSLASESIESSVSGLILASMEFADPGQLEALKRNLLELSRYFLETGDFQSLEQMYCRLRASVSESGRGGGDVGDAVLRSLESAGFAAEVVCGLDVWGKVKYREIGSLIQRVGRPFIEPLLDRLAGEENRTLRRWCLDQLLKMASSAKEAVLARLNDPRWYFVRNLVIILQHSGDPAVLPHLAAVARFPHPRVRQIVLETYLRFRYPEGDRLLLHDLNSGEPGERLRAIRHAGKSRDPQVRQALLKILGAKGLSPEWFEAKKAAIHSLARMGCADVLPVLEGMLASRHFFRRALHDTLKREIVLSLARYGDSSAVALLQKVARWSNPLLSVPATEMLAELGGCDD